MHVSIGSTASTVAHVLEKWPV